MKKIGLKVGRAVIAYDPDYSGPGQHGGNVGVDPGDKLGWKCENDGHEFLVRFYRFGTSDGIWPFEGEADVVEAGIEYLKVRSTEVTTKTLNTGETLKYEVKLVRPNDTNVAPLDPTIIIRPTVPIMTSSGLAWAAVGAAVGAAVTLIFCGD